MKIGITGVQGCIDWSWVKKAINGLLDLESSGKMFHAVSETDSRWRKPVSVGAVASGIKDEVATSDASVPIVGVSSLALGSDQIFAQLVLNRGGTLYTVVPFEDYEDAFYDQSGVDEFRRLLDLSADKEVLSAKASYDESFVAAAKRVVDLSDVVFAVWNGKREPGLAYAQTTMAAVDYALWNKKPLFHINQVSKSICIHGLFGVF